MILPRTTVWLPFGLQHGEQTLMEGADVRLQKVQVEVLFILKMVVDHGLGEARCIPRFPAWTRRRSPFWKKP